MKIAVLYIGGCSLNRHYENARNDLPAYIYYENTGNGWSETNQKSISDAIKEDDWDYISIQHGPGDGSRYTNPKSYEKLEPLIEYIKSLTPKSTKIAFNMAWVMEKYSTHPEIQEYDLDQMRMYRNLTELTNNVVRVTKGLDIVSPAGTAIQNARTTVLSDKLSRDGFHLSYGIGRYIAGLTFLKALTDTDIDATVWSPDGISEDEKLIAIRCTNDAIAVPYDITTI